MPDLEKVIRGLEVCTANGSSCDGCPYYEPVETIRCDCPMMEDALALLREQETEYKPDGPDFTKHGPAVRWKCSNCQYYVLTEDEETKPNMKFCPNCGRAVKWDA